MTHKTALKAVHADGKPQKRVGRPRKVSIATPGASSAEDDSAENVPVYATLAAKIRAQVLELWVCWSLPWAKTAFSFSLLL